MEVFVLTFVFIGLAALGMATGLVVRGSALKGTCATLDGDCDVCQARRRRGELGPENCPRRAGRLTRQS